MVLPNNSNISYNNIISTSKRKKKQNRTSSHHDTIPISSLRQETCICQDAFIILGSTWLLKNPFFQIPFSNNFGRNTFASIVILLKLVPHSQLCHAPLAYRRVHSFAVSTASVSFVFQCFAMFSERGSSGFGALNRA